MRFEPNIQERLWGAESWEISVHPRAPSIIADGPAKGRTLRDVHPDFPLLFKVIDARKRLSLQVHPSSSSAAVTGGDPKTEMYCALKDGVIYAGFKNGVTLTDVKHATVSGRLEQLLVVHHAKPFDVFLIPGGLVHALGDGMRVYEVQQSSDTTWRLFDWDRLGSDGRPRLLHIREALATVDLSLPAPVPVPGGGLDCPFFSFSQRVFERPSEISAPTDSFLAVYEVESGVSALLEPGESMETPAGRVFLTRKSV